MKEYKYLHINPKQALLFSIFVIILIVVFNLWISQHPDLAMFRFVFSLFASLIPAYLILNRLIGLKNPTLRLENDCFIIPSKPKFLRSFVSDLYPFFTCYEKVYFNTIIEVRNGSSQLRGNFFLVRTGNGEFALYRSNFSDSDYPEIIKYIYEKAPEGIHNAPKRKFSPLIFALIQTGIYLIVYFLGRLQVGEIDLKIVFLGWALFIILGLVFGSAPVLLVETILKAMKIKN